MKCPRCNVFLDKAPPLICDTCAFEIPALEEVTKVVVDKVFKIDPSEDTSQLSIPDWTVFIHHPAGEAEVPSCMLEQHIRATGKLPEIDKPLFAMPFPGNRAVVVPYGRVVRITKNS